MTRSRDHAARIWNRTEEHTYLVNTKYVNINLYYTCMYIYIYIVYNKHRSNGYSALKKCKYKSKYKICTYKSL